MVASWIRFAQSGIHDGRYVIGIETHEGEDEIYFSVPPDFFAHSDSVAAALATLCGKKYEGIEFQFPVSPVCRGAISERTGAKVQSSENGVRRPPGRNLALGFSGGFDSLAAHFIAPQQIRIAVAFGSWFEREREFFETLAPEVVCRTDFREKGYADSRDRRRPPLVTRPVKDHDWLFMSAASLLFADYLDLRGVGLGTIFEATLFNYRLIREARQTGLGRFLEAVGLIDTTLTRGLTEFGTARLLLHYAPELVDGSISSLAPQKSEKRLRKRLMVDMTRHLDGGLPPDFESYEYPEKKLTYGNSYPIDFLALLFVRLYGSNVVSRWVEGLKRVDLGALGKIDIGWIYRYNTLFLEEIPPELRCDVVSRMRTAGIEDFRDEDWLHYRAFREILAVSHRFPK